jgi:transglutaminase-like putative cysteine protease
MMLKRRPLRSFRLFRPALAAGAAPVRWSFALLFLALASHTPTLSPLALGLLALALASRFAPRQNWVMAARLFFLAVVVVAYGLTDGWLAADTLRLALLLVLALKWAEARQAREFTLLACAAVVAAAIGLLQWGENVKLLLVFILPILFLGALESAAAAATVTVTAAAPLAAPSAAPGAFPIRLRRILGAMALALPLAATLFLFFPRIPGPLWDIGISFGLPLSLGLEKSNQGLGVSTRLKPGQGQAQTGVAESHPVLVAEFENWVPPTALLYWRGPVYYDFDGREWRLAPEYEAGQGRRIMRQGWTKAADFSARLARKTHEIRYQIRLTPHDRLWLYGLDLPARLTAESFIGPDWQVLSHHPVRKETRYALSSWLEWEAGGALPEESRARALALPQTGNPRLYALGKQLATLPDPEARIKTALTALAKEGYKVRDQFEFKDDPNALDHFWFETRTGDANLYAGAFVLLMRAADIPARLVTGYRGGKLMALTDYVIVKKSHAHAWAEVWSDARGWRRIDPVDLIAPERFASAQTTPKPVAPKIPQAAKAAKTAKPTANSANTAPPHPATAPQRNGAPAAPRADTPNSLLLSGKNWRLPDPGALLQRWIFHLDGETQQTLLAGLQKNPAQKFAWAWLLGGAALSSALVFAFLQCFARWRDHRRLPAPERDWNRLCRLLAKRGFTRDTWESPNDFARRVGAAQPIWESALTALANAYANWRYAATGNPGAVKHHARRLYNLVMASPATAPAPQWTEKPHQQQSFLSTPPTAP